TGPTGATGTITTVAGTFFDFQTGPFNNGDILPVSTESSVNTPGFTVVGGGVQVTNGGLYLADGRVQINSGSQATVGLQINGGGIFVPYFNAGGASSPAGSATVIIVINAILSLNPGDIVSLGLITGGPVTLESAIGGTITPTTAIRLVKIN
ncbi:hypothetical protein CON35_31925, partial [Bacillus cereus]